MDLNDHIRQHNQNSKKIPRNVSESVLFSSLSAKTNHFGNIISISLPFTIKTHTNRQLIDLKYYL